MGGCNVLQFYPVSENMLILIKHNSEILSDIMPAHVVYIIFYLVVK